MKQKQKPATRVEFAMLGAALAQEGWQVECQSFDGTPPKKFDISDFRLIPFDAGDVGLSIVLKRKNDETLLTAVVDRVFIDGQLGLPDEPRRFAVSLYCDSRKYREREYLRTIKPRKIGLVFVRDENAPPGWPMYKSHFHSSPYGFQEHLRRYGSGDNQLRTDRLAQPKTLQVGDRLATGDRVLSPPRKGYNGSVLIHLTGGHDGHWIEVAPRLPIALLTKADNAPKELWEM